MGNNPSILKRKLGKVDLRIERFLLHLLKSLREIEGFFYSKMTKETLCGGSFF